MDEYSLSDLALASGNNDGFGGGNAWVLILLFAMIFGGGGFFGNNNTSRTTTTEDLTNAMNFNDLQSQNRDILNAVQQSTYDTAAIVKDASYANLTESRDIQAAISAGFANQQSCCCETLRAIDGVNYNASLNTANITAAIHSEAEATRNMIQQDKIEALQSRINTLELNNALGPVVRYPTSTSYAVASPCFNNSCGCNYASI